MARVNTCCACRSLFGRFYTSVSTAFNCGYQQRLKLLDDDERKVVLTILDDISDVNSPQLIKVLRSADNANHDLVYGYVGVKQWEEFTETFDVSKNTTAKDGCLGQRSMKS
jgi:hypothetical protein